MKNKLVCFFISVIFCLSFVIGVSAEEKASNAQLAAELVFDKEEYDSSENIEATVVVNNTGAAILYGVTPEIILPEGFVALWEGDADIHRLVRGESYEFKASVVKSPLMSTDVSDSADTSSQADTSQASELEVPKSPQTGDSVAVWVVLMMIAFGTAVVVAVKSRRGTKFFSLILCVALLGTVALPAGAERIQKEVSASGEITVDGETVAVEAVVTYRHEDTCEDYVIEGDTWYVYTAEGLLAWNEAVNNYDYDANLVLMDDIVLPLETADGKEIVIADGIPDGSNWIPPRTFSVEDSLFHYVYGTDSYKGTINGNGKSISNLCINTYEVFACGFVASLAPEGRIENLTLKNAYIHGGVGTDSVGGFAGTNFGGTIVECHFEGSITAVTDFSTSAGGIAGISSLGYIDGNKVYPRIEKCSNFGDISVEYFGESKIYTYDENGEIESVSFPYIKAGGIAGLSSTVVSCVNGGTIYVNGAACSVGGIAGMDQPGDGMKDCVNSGNVAVISRDVAKVGGIIGEVSTGSVTGCLNNGKVTVTGKEVYADGIMGYGSADAKITDCTNEGVIAVEQN